MELLRHHTIYRNKDTKSGVTIPDDEDYYRQEDYFEATSKTNTGVLQIPTISTIRLIDLSVRGATTTKQRVGFPYGTTRTTINKQTTLKTLPTETVAIQLHELQGEKLEFNRLKGKCAQLLSFVGNTCLGGEEVSWKPRKGISVFFLRGIWSSPEY